MKSLVFLAASVLLMLSAGCEHDSYVVEITPRGDSFQRRLTCWHVGGDKESEIRPLDAEQLDRLAKLYDKRETPDGAKKHIFVGRFTGPTPAGVGGAGSYTRFSSPLGSFSSYVERFRGNDDLQAELAKRRNAADKITDLLLDWLETELGNQPGFARLKKFIDQDLRRDLTNIGFYEWTHRAVEKYKSDMGHEFLIRAGQYLCERGYFSPKDVPVLARAVLNNDPAPLLASLKRLVVREMGLPADQQAPRALAFLSDPERVEASWKKYVESTDIFKQRIRQWEEEKNTDPDAKKPTADDLTPDDLLGEETLKFLLGKPPDSLELKLYSGQKPWTTNGAWDEQTAAVSWGETLGQNPALPVVCFASWSSADRAKQNRHFGKVVLQGKELAQYVLWYEGLSPEESQQWDPFIAGCRPGSDLKRRIETFRFVADPKPQADKPDEQPASLADSPRKLILQGLEPEEE